MALGSSLKISCGDVFPHGCGVVSKVTSANDFEKSTRENPVQARDKETGQLVWQVDVMDFDPEARERQFRVKIAADHQPVPPDAIPGTPVRPVILEGLTVTPYVKEGKYPKVAYSLRCTGLGNVTGGASSFTSASTNTKAASDARHEDTSARGRGRGCWSAGVGTRVVRR